MNDTINTDSSQIVGLRRFSAELRQDLPSARIDFVNFPSGAAMLDVAIGDRLFVLESRANGECGVSEVHDGEGFTAGHEFTSVDWMLAAGQLKCLVKAADRIAEVAAIL